MNMQIIAFRSYKQKDHKSKMCLLGIILQKYMEM